MSLHLERLATFHGRRGPLLLIIADGIGLAPPGPGNAVALADTPVLDKLLASKMKTELKAHGTAVGLPSDEDMGNSEVGHNALGGGRIFAQGAKLVNHALASGEIYESELWREIARRGQEGRTVHFIGLLSDGNVHSHIDHLLALLARCAEDGVKRARIHVLLDGRDVPERSAPQYLETLEQKLETLRKEYGADYRVASGGGRMVTTMDRYEADWSIVERGWNAHVHGIGRPFPSALAAVETMYAENPEVNDQYLDPFVIVGDDGEPVGRIEDGDAVIFFNFRGDRAIEISRAFEEEEFDAFDRGRVPDVLYCGMLQYDGDLKIPGRYLVAPPVIEHTMSEYLCAEEVPSFAVSETQKFGHVTYFWNGNRSGYIDEKLETYIEIPSDNIEFDRKPAMKAREITAETIELLRSGHYRFGRINFANGDMVGHTGNLQAAIEAVETVDRCTGELIEVVQALDGIVIFTADHGNAEQMFTEKNGVRAPVTSHTLNPVPFVIVDPANDGDYVMAEIGQPGLANVAATVLNLLGYRAPPDYEPSLVEFPREPLRRQLIYPGAIVNLGLETTRLPNGELLALEIVRHPGGAVVVAVDDEERVCLMRQFRHAADGWIWELPAGVLELFEPPVSTAKRELREEAGLEAREWDDLGPIFTSPGFSTEELHLFLARGLTHHAPQREKHEFIEIHWTPLEEAMEMALGGEIEDAKTIIGLCRAAARLEKPPG